MPHHILYNFSYILSNDGKLQDNYVYIVHCIMYIVERLIDENSYIYVEPNYNFYEE